MPLKNVLVEKKNEVGGKSIGGGRVMIWMYIPDKPCTEPTDTAFLAHRAV